MAPGKQTISLLLSVALGALCSTNGFSAEAKSSAPMVWPAPPERPRIALVKAITKPSDFGAKSGGIRKFARWISGVDEGDGILDRPFGISADESGSICFTDTATASVLYYDSGSKQLRHWDEIARKRFVAPTSAVKRGKLIYVADSALPALVAFDLEGKEAFRIGDPLVRPSGLAISGDRVLVADAGAHCVVVFDLTGKQLSRFGSRGDGPGEFNFPTHIAADSKGNVYVTDSVNRRVEVFDTEGKFLRQIGRPGDGPGCFGRPKGVAVDAENRIYVVDAVFENFQIFNAEGQLLLDVGQAGSGSGEFWLPNGVAIGDRGRIFVTDTYNSRIQIFEPVGGK